MASRNAVKKKRYQQDWLSVYRSLCDHLSDIQRVSGSENLLPEFSELQWFQRSGTCGNSELYPCSEG